MPDESSTEPKRSYKRKTSPGEMNPNVAYQMTVDMQRIEHKKRMERLSLQMEYDKEEHEQRLRVMRLQEKYWSERLQETSHVETAADEEKSSNIPPVSAVYAMLD